MSFSRTITTTQIEFEPITQEDGGNYQTGDLNAIVVNEEVTTEHGAKMIVLSNFPNLVSCNVKSFERHTAKYIMSDEVFFANATKYVPKKRGNKNV